MTEVVAVDGVSKTFRPSSRFMSLLIRSPLAEPVEALVDVSFRLRAGTTTVLLGANGAGKSTMLKILMGLVTADEGQAMVLGRSSADRDPAVLRAIGYMPSDDRSLYLRLTCEQNLRFQGRAHGMAAEELDRRIPAVLHSVGLPGMEERAAFGLSAGMRARLQLARALIHDPLVLLLDEPTGTIDPLAAARLVELIGQTTAERGIATLMTTHRLDDLDVLDDDVMILSTGRVIHHGSVASLRSGAGRGGLVLTFDSHFAATTAARRLREAWPHVQLPEQESSVLRFAVEAPLGHVLALLPDVVSHLLDASVVTPSIREVLAVLTEPAP